MNVATRSRAMTREEFLLWVEGQDGRYEFDGLQPVAMTGGTNNHGIISGNIYFALRIRLGGDRCRPMTAESGGVATGGNKVRYPDVTVTCAPVPGTDRLIPDPVVLFEVVSDSSVREDYGDKRIEYQAMPSVLRYVVVEQDSDELTVLHRDGHGGWQEFQLREGGILAMPEIGVELPVSEIYERVAFGA